MTPVHEHFAAAIKQHQLVALAQERQLTTAHAAASERAYQEFRYANPTATRREREKLRDSAAAWRAVGVPAAR